MTEIQVAKLQHGLGCLAKLALLVIVLFVAFMFLASGLGSGQIDALIAVTFGWLSFLKRTIPAVSWNWDLVGMAVLCVITITLLGHRFAVWLSSQLIAQRGKSWRWPWRWTWCSLIGINLMFLVGMAVGGAVHQAGWIAGSAEPWFERKPRYLEEMMQIRELDYELRIAMGDTNTVAGIRQNLRDSDAEKRSLERRKHSLLDSFHILFVSTNGANVDGIIVFPRNPELKSRLNGYFITEADSAPIFTNQLSDLLKERAQFILAF